MADHPLEIWDNETIRAVKAAAPIEEGYFDETDLADRPAFDGLLHGAFAR
jgi:hypothetical protein